MKNIIAKGLAIHLVFVKMKVRQFIGLYLFLFFAASLTLAQTPNINQKAVDTLAKDVAISVFMNLQLSPNNLTASEIYNQLMTCGDSCDVTNIIRRVGGYNAVELKIQELSKLKRLPQFQSMSPSEANAAIRKQLIQFYNRYKNDKNYGKPLSPTVQEQMLAKIDEMLPPSTEPVIDKVDPTISTIPSSSTDNGPATEPAIAQRQENNYLMIFISALLGLLGGAAAVYFLLFRATKAEEDRLRFENSQLSRSLDAAQRNKPSNESRQPQNDYRQKANAYDDIRAELGTNIDPLVAIRQLKQQAISSTPNVTSGVRSGIPDPIKPIVETPAVPEPTPVQSQPTPVQPANTPRSEVFYFPPPDPNGQFDNEQKSSTLSPESAYRFSVDTARKEQGSDQPIVASFRFEAEPGRVARFLTYRNYMIEPACESENSYFATHTRIIMRRDGVAVLENGVWRVKQKALIRYE